MLEEGFEVNKRGAHAARRAPKAAAEMIVGFATVDPIRWTEDTAVSESVAAQERNIFNLFCGIDAASLPMSS